MKHIVLIVEDEPLIKKVLSAFLERAGEISFIFASSVVDAVELYERNKELIAYIALDGNLTPGFSEDYPETIDLAKKIAEDKSFNGIVFAMSSRPDHCQSIKDIIGSDRCKIVDNDNIKVGTIKEIIRMIKEQKT